MKIKINESQYNQLIERKVLNSILEQINKHKNSLNESMDMNEAISNTLRDYLRKGLLTAGVLAGLMMNNVSAQELQSAGVPPDNIAKAEQLMSAKKIDLGQIERAFLKHAEKNDRIVLGRYNSLPQEKKIAVLKVIRNNINNISDIRNLDFGLLLGSNISPDKMGNKLTNIGKEVVKVVSVDTVYTISSTPVGDYFVFNSSQLSNPEQLKDTLQTILDSYTKIDAIKIIASSSALRNTREAEGKTWLELSTERANSIKGVLVGMDASFGGCGVNPVQVNESLITVNAEGQNGDGTSGPPSPYEKNQKYIDAYEQNGIDPKFWRSNGQGNPLSPEQIDQYQQYQYVNVEITGTVMLDKVEDMPNYDYLSIKVREEGGKVKAKKVAGKQDVSVCKIQVKKVKKQKMKF